jgi:hypothetical protein
VQAATERVCSLIAAVRSHNAKRGRFSLAVALLLSALLWRTTWPSLRPGLIILLIGYLGTALLFLYRNTKLGAEARQMRNDAAKSEGLFGWFDRQESFAVWSTRAEAGLRALGFLVLGYGFWLATHSGIIALLLGIGYPALTYFGVERRNNQRAAQALRTEKQALSKLIEQYRDSVL